MMADTLSFTAKVDQEVPQQLRITTTTSGLRDLPPPPGTLNIIVVPARPENAAMKPKPVFFSRQFPKDTVLNSCFSQCGDE